MNKIFKKIHKYIFINWLASAVASKNTISDRCLHFVLLHFIILWGHLLRSTQTQPHLKFSSKDLEVFVREMNLVQVSTFRAGTSDGESPYEKQRSEESQSFTFNSGSPVINSDFVFLRLHTSIFVCFHLHLIRTVSVPVVHYNSAEKKKKKTLCFLLVFL